MRSIIALFCVSAFGLSQAPPEKAAPARLDGTYDLLVCAGSCTFDATTNAVVKGTLVLFDAPLDAATLQSFGERSVRFEPEGVNGCYALDVLRKTGSYVGISKHGLTHWNWRDGHYEFSLFRSPDAGYVALVEPTPAGLAGTGYSWGAGVAAPKERTTETIIARRTGDAALSNCAP